ncbi:hypothetical protein OG339_47275 (plasmid) [Streptosporangium sp. NBC_01495]|uniref:hypothetical protein n=1 Tax=Streptosporangium sp. NBC_01495 TaxID=2903899 RepID=UPI002E313232|nr:hypothetical protein [Streptosporangium sp. NBC_01495]
MRLRFTDLAWPGSAPYGLPGRSDPTRHPNEDRRGLSPLFWTHINPRPWPGYEHLAEIEAARECLVTAISNVDILLQMLSGLSALFDQD